MQRLCEDDLSSHTQAAGLGGFLLKSHSIGTLVTKAAQNHFKYMPIVPEFVSFSKINNSKVIVWKTILFVPGGSLLNQHSHSPSPLGPFSDHQDQLLLQPILSKLLNRFRYLIRTGCS